MTIVADIGARPAYVDAVVTGRDQDGKTRAEADPLCGRAGIDPETLAA